MKINEVISKHFEELKSKCHNDDKIISMSRTSEDVLQDVCLTAMRKYKNKDVDEQEALAYLQKTLFYELKFQLNRIDTKLVFVENFKNVDKADEDTEK